MLKGFTISPRQVSALESKLITHISWNLLLSLDLLLSLALLSKLILALSLSHPLVWCRLPSLWRDRTINKWQSKLRITIKYTSTLERKPLCRETSNANWDEEKFVNLLLRFCWFLSCWLPPFVISMQQWLSWWHQRSNRERHWRCWGLHILRGLTETASSGKTKKEGKKR